MRDEDREDETSSSLASLAGGILRNLTNSQILAISLCFMFPGISLAVLSESPLLWEKLIIALITELGFAFFIAWVIISTVDEREKEKALVRMKNLSDKLDSERKMSERRLNSRMYLSHVLGLDLPRNVSEELNEYIITSKLMKTQQSVKYRITPCGNFTKFNQILDATFQNVDSDKFIFESPFESYDSENSEIEGKFPEVPWGLHKVNVLFCKAGSAEWVEHFEYARPEQLAIGCARVDEDAFQMEALTLLPGDLVRFHVEYQAAKYATDNEVFTNKSLCSTMFAEIVYDKDQYEVNYRPLHPRKNVMNVIQDSGGDTVRFNYPFLPSHGFVTWWRRIGLSED